jgi:LL-diaminopimelate aminotransferase
MTGIVPKGALYVWAKVPEGVKCDEFAIEVLEKCGVWMTPGTAFGEHGEGFMRLSVCVPEERLKEAGERLSKL